MIFFISDKYTNKMKMLAKLKYLQMSEIFLYYYPNCPSESVISSEYYHQHIIMIGKMLSPIMAAVRISFLTH